MKGMIISPIVFLILISIFSIVYVSSMKTIELRDVVSQDILANRIYYKFLMISDSTVEIIEKELGDISKNVIFNSTVDEQPDFSYVTFTERLPQDVGDFNQDLVNYEKFVETYLNETNVVVDTGIGGLGGRMRAEIEPYGIVYDHIPPWGQRQYDVTPNDSDDSLGKLNSYNITVKLVNGWIVSPPGSWSPKKKGDLQVTIKVISDGGTPIYETTDSMSRNTKSTFQIATSGPQTGWIKVTISGDNPGGLLFEMHLAEAIVSTQLNLTEIPGETRVDLPDGKINVIESLYDIQKNDTVSLGG